MIAKSLDFSFIMTTRQDSMITLVIMKRRQGFKVSFVTELSVTFDSSIFLLIALSAMSGTNGSSWFKLTAPSLETLTDDMFSCS